MLIVGETAYVNVVGPPFQVPVVIPFAVRVIVFPIHTAKVPGPVIVTLVRVGAAKHVVE